MSKIPLVDAKMFEKVLIHLGFAVKRQKGSHVFYRHPDGRYTTLPHHKDRVIGRSLTRAILRQIEVTPDEYKKILQEV